MCDAYRSISAEFGGIRDSCLDIYHLIFGGKIERRAGREIGMWSIRYNCSWQLQMLRPTRSLPSSLARLAAPRRLVKIRSPFRVFYSEAKKLELHRRV